MKIYYCGKEACESGHFFGPAVRQHYLVHFVLDGKGILKTDHGIFKLRGGEAFLIRPDEVTYYKADQKQPWRYAWVAFDGAKAKTLLAQYYPDQKNPVCSIGDLGAVPGWFEGLHSSFGRREEKRERVLGYFYLLFSCLTRMREWGEALDEEGHYQKALAFIRNNYGYQIQIQDVADYTGIDRTYLYRIFMRQRGESPKQYLSRFRLERAKDMLQNTAYKITEIAYSCGFHDSSSFCRYFQKAVGCSPVRYRKTHHISDP